MTGLIDSTDSKGPVVDFDSRVLVVMARQFERWVAAGFRASASPKGVANVLDGWAATEVVNAAGVVWLFL